jgi:NAD+ diphosphatase
MPGRPQIFLGLNADGEPRFAVDGKPTTTSRRRNGCPRGRCLLQTACRPHRPGALRARLASPARLLRQLRRADPAGKAGYSRQCDNCGAEHFPRVDPVVIMLAEKDGLALVGRGPRFPAGFFSALAGFVEPGESLEEAVARELHEEAGIRVHSVRYGASQPWPFPSSLMMGAFAQAEGFELALDESEIAEARWVSREEVRAVLRGEGSWSAPPPLAIAHWLLQNWAQQP